MPRGKKKKPMTDAHKKALAEARKKDKVAVLLESQTFTLSSDKHNWIADFDGEKIYHSRLRHLCIALLERKIKKSEVRDIQGLKDVIEKAVNEICFHIPNAVK